jgi:hypothetical protein
MVIGKSYFKPIIQDTLEAEVEAFTVQDWPRQKSPYLKN